MKVFIDTCIPMYAAGSAHPLKKNCVDIMQSIADQKIQAYSDTEVFQEILYRFFNINRRELGLQIFDLFSTILDGNVLPVRLPDVRLARNLATIHPYLSPRDLIHLAAMQNNGIRKIITADKGFTKIAGIQVIYP